MPILDAHIICLLAGITMHVEHASWLRHCTTPIRPNLVEVHCSLVIHSKVHSHRSLPQGWREFLLCHSCWQLPPGIAEGHLLVHPREYTAAWWCRSRGLSHCPRWSREYIPVIDGSRNTFHAWNHAEFHVCYSRTAYSIPTDMHTPKHSSTPHTRLHSTNGTRLICGWQFLCITASDYMFQPLIRQSK